MLKFKIIVAYSKTRYIFAQEITTKKIEIMKIEIKKFNSLLNITDVFLNGVLVGTIGISGGFTYLKSSKVTWQEDDAIMDALRNNK